MFNTASRPFFADWRQIRCKLNQIRAFDPFMFHMISRDSVWGRFPEYGAQIEHGPQATTLHEGVKRHIKHGITLILALRILHCQNDNATFIPDPHNGTHLVIIYSTSDFRASFAFLSHFTTVIGCGLCYRLTNESIFYSFVCIICKFVKRAK